jgi:thiol-disulfide isomerase/thioredoxin
MKVKGLIKTIQNLPTITRIGVYILIFIAFRFLLDALFNSLRNLKIMKEGMDGMGGKKFVLFHWKNCGHCKKMMPEWNKFQSNYKGNINVSKIEKDENPALIKKLSITGYPTVLLLDDNNNKIESYSGERNSNAFMNYLKNKE